MHTRNTYPLGRAVIFVPLLLLGGCEDMNMILDIIRASVDLTLAIVEVAS